MPAAATFAAPTTKALRRDLKYVPEWIIKLWHQFASVIQVFMYPLMPVAYLLNGVQKMRGGFPRLCEQTLLRSLNLNQAPFGSVTAGVKADEIDLMIAS